MAAPSPMIPMTARTIIAAAYEVLPRLETRIGAGHRRAQRRAEIGDAARQARDLALLFLAEGRLHDIDGRGQHHADAQTEQQQPGGERPGAGRTLDEGEEYGDADDCGARSPP